MGPPWLAAVGIGTYPSVEAACEHLVQVTGKTEMRREHGRLRQTLPALSRALPNPQSDIRRTKLTIHQGSLHRSRSFLHPILQKAEVPFPLFV